MPDEALRNLEELLLRSRQGPALDGERQDKPVQASAESVGPDPHEHAHRMGAEPRTGKPGPVGGGFPFLDPLLLAHQVANPVGATTVGRPCTRVQRVQWSRVVVYRSLLHRRRYNGSTVPRADPSRQVVLLPQAYPAASPGISRRALGDCRLAPLAVCPEPRVDGARPPPRRSGLTCPAHSDSIGATCHGASAS
jgi:hypothetical protein